MANVTLKHIYKVYPGGVQAVSDFTLDIEDKEFVVLVGPSGCGKTTTLRMVAGLEEISEGELYIGDKLANDIPPKDRDIAMVFQSYALYPHMTVYDNMAFGLKLRKTPKTEIDRRVKEAAKTLGIDHLLTRKPAALSGGQRQRVALGRAMVREPKVFLMDEPLSNLDAKLRVQTRTVITRLHQKLGTTFVYVTHDQTEAMTMGTRIVVMKDGVIQQVAAPQFLYDNPNNLFVAGFIGMPPMNFFDAKLEKDGNDLYAVFGANRLMVPAERAAQFDPSYFDKEVTMGVRPEDMYDGEEYLAAHSGSVISAYAEVVELMGSETYLYLLVDGREGSVTARVDPRTRTRAGDNIKVAFDMRHVHFFDKETENTILIVNT
ncbi:MAG: sn-glycerol-3-phosphate ABC transporter ATP-binding protein UgpC [Eubacteriales bacterium]|nr:sn-glycerol-3-phosphate ABC transporter ATP-binding protein UgpC [Eubacteriales bacterium]